MIDETLFEAEEKMERAVEFAKEEFAAIRTGRATPGMFAQIIIDYYGAPTPLPQMASIAIPEPRMVIIKPYDPSQLKAMEKAIRDSDLGVNPNNEGTQLRINLPQMTEERRREMIKVARHKGEEAKVAIRNVRRKAKEELDRIVKDGEAGEDDGRRAEKELDDLTHKFVGARRRAPQAQGSRVARGLMSYAPTRPIATYRRDAPDAACRCRARASTTPRRGLVRHSDGDDASASRCTARAGRRPRRRPRRRRPATGEMPGAGRPPAGATAPVPSIRRRLRRRRAAPPTVPRRSRAATRRAGRAPGPPSGASRGPTRPVTAGPAVGTTPADARPDAATGRSMAGSRPTVRRPDVATDVDRRPRIDAADGSPTGPDASVPTDRAHRATPTQPSRRRAGRRRRRARARAGTCRRRSASACCWPAIVLGSLFLWRPAFVAVLAVGVGVGVWELVRVRLAAGVPRRGRRRGRRRHLGAGPGDPRPAAPTRRWCR